MRYADEIARCRTRRGVLAPRTPEGRLPAGTVVRYRLQRHACRFGVNLHHWGLVEPALQTELEAAAMAGTAFRPSLTAPRPA